MGKIRVLAPDVADRLRAGEVIERPSGAVKELVENSLDARALHINVEVKKGGKTEISVADDGEGMGTEDALLSLKRHATSKISALDDLSGITTLGFRGEALPSIAAVSDLVLTTAPAGAGLGLKVEAKAGQVTGWRPAPARGTEVSVRGLFFNTPARKKFLKSDQTENLHIIDALTRQALSHPKTGFSLRMDGRLSMELPPATDERERIAQIYGAGFLEGLRNAERNGPEFGLKLFFSREGNWRATRSHQFIFVNGRPVKDAGLGHAVYAGLSGLPAGRHPIFFVFIEADPKGLDINVHPQKEEVRLEDRDRLWRLIRGAAAEAGRAGIQTSGAPDKEPSPPRGVSEETAEYGSGPAASLYTDVLYTDAGAVGKKRCPFIRLGEMFYAYADSEGQGGQGVWLLDQHAAHERVMYEKLLRNVRLSPGRFLFPLLIELAPASKQAVLAHRELLSGMGFEVEEFGGGSLMLRSAPEEFLKKGSPDYASLIEEAAMGFLEERDSGAEELKRKIAARLACHGSVRGAEVLGEAEFESLLDELDRCEDPEHCPHGRPTRLRLDIDQLKKMFKRK